MLAVEADFVLPLPTVVGRSILAESARMRASGTSSFGGPEAAVLCEPAVDFAQAGVIDAVDAALGIDLHLDQTRFAQGLEVLRDGGRRDGEAGGNFARGTRACAKQFEDGAAIRAGQGGEGIHSDMM